MPRACAIFAITQSEGKLWLRHAHTKIRKAMPQASANLATSKNIMAVHSAEPKVTENERGISQFEINSQLRTYSIEYLDSLIKISNKYYM